VVRHGSVSVFLTRYRFSVFFSVFSKSVRFSVSVFLYTAVSVRFFGFFFIFR
jgi:hypothetical protein